MRTHTSSRWWWCATQRERDTCPRHRLFSSSVSWTRGREGAGAIGSSGEHERKIRSTAVKRKWDIWLPVKAPTSTRGSKNSDISEAWLPLSFKFCCVPLLRIFGYSMYYVQTSYSQTARHETTTYTPRHIPVIFLSGAHGVTASLYPRGRALAAAMSEVEIGLCSKQGTHERTPPVLARLRPMSRSSSLR